MCVAVLVRPFRRSGFHPAFTDREEVAAGFGGGLFHESGKRPNEHGGVGGDLSGEGGLGQVESRVGVGPMIWRWMFLIASLAAMGDRHAGADGRSSVAAEIGKEFF